MTDYASTGFLGRHELLIRRLHSLTGLIPVGAYMVVHLLTNASVLNGAATYQKAVYQIHSLGAILPLVEWLFIFLPLFFHTVIGVAIIRGGLPNTSRYQYGANIRYTLQRASGMVAMLFILFHIMQLHGLLHFDWWLDNVVRPWGGAQFAPYNATSTAAEAVQSSVMVSAFYLIGIAACVFHLANGIWTMGITWGAWITPAAQKRAGAVCTAFGVGLMAVSLAAWGGFTFMSDDQIEQAKQVEEKLWDAKVEAGELDKSKDGHKKAGHEDEHAAAMAK